MAASCTRISGAHTRETAMWKGLVYPTVWMSSGQIHARSSTKAAETVVSLLCRESSSCRGSCTRSWTAFASLSKGRGGIVIDFNAIRSMTDRYTRVYVSTVYTCMWNVRLYTRACIFDNEVSTCGLLLDRLSPPLPHKICLIYLSIFVSTLCCNKRDDCLPN